MSIQDNVPPLQGGVKFLSVIQRQNGRRCGMSHACGHAATLLEAFGFEASFWLPQEAFELELGDCVIEEYLGWEIQTEPNFAVIHRRTGHGWTALFCEIENTERVKILIRKGFEADCWNAMEVGR